MSEEPRPGFDPAANEEERLRDVDEILSAEATWAEPDAGVLDGLIAAMSSQTGANLGRRPPRRRTMLFAAGLGLALLAGVLLIWSIVGDESVPTEQVFALNGTELAPDAAGQIAVAVTPSGWWLRLEVTGLEGAPLGSYYEGWVSNGRELVSIGTFHLRDGNDPVVLWSGVDLVEYSELLVTLEEEGLGPEPSQQMMLTGRVHEDSGY